MIFPSRKNDNGVLILSHGLKYCLCFSSIQAGTILVAGMGMFCGALYHQALTGDPGLRKMAPYGGMAMIAGWLAIFL